VYRRAGLRAYNVQHSLACGPEAGPAVERYKPKKGGPVPLRIGRVLFLGGLSATLFAQSDSSEKAARAIFATKCITCHGQMPMSDFDIRDRVTILKGGKRGPAIVPGKAAESLLYKAILRNGELKMPRGMSALSAAEINIIRDWINGGAHWTPSASGAAAAPSWWSFQKPVRRAAPAVR